MSQNVFNALLGTEIHLITRTATEFETFKSSTIKKIFEMIKEGATKNRLKNNAPLNIWTTF